MEILKKIGGYLLMIIALLLAIAIVATLPNSILKSLDQIQKYGITGIGYFVGAIGVDIVFTLITIFMIKKSMKLIRNKKDESDNTIGLQ